MKQRCTEVSTLDTIFPLGIGERKLEDPLFLLCPQLGFALRGMLLQLSLEIVLSRKFYWEFYFAIVYVDIKFTEKFGSELFHSVSYSIYQK